MIIDTNTAGLEVARAVHGPLYRRFSWAERENYVCYDVAPRPGWTCEVTVVGGGLSWFVKLRVTQIKPPKKTYVSSNLNGSIRTLKHNGKNYGLRIRAVAYGGTV
jgi:hypothetical protein